MARVFLITLLLSLASAPAKASMVVDDFEVGVFNFAAAAGDTVDQNIYIMSPGHTIWPTRHVTMRTGSSAIGVATLSPGSHLDDEVVYTADGFCFLVFEFDWGFPVDLTEGGGVESLGVDLSMVPASGEVYVTMSDPNVLMGLNFGHPGTGLNKYPFSRFLDVDPTRATSLSIGFYITDGGQFQINDIRTIGVGATTPNFVVEAFAVQTPPIPSPPIRWRAFDPAGQPLYRANVPITRADAGHDLAMRAEWSETAALGGEIAGMAFSWLEPSAFVDSDFEIGVEMSRFMGMTPEIFYPPDPIAGARSFVLAFPIVVRNNTGQEIGRSDTRLVFDVGAGQALEFAGVQVLPGGAGKAEATTGFRVAFRLKREGNVDEALPVFEARWEADWRPAAVLTAVDPGASSEPEGMAALALSARPSVTRGATEIRASLPFASDGAVTIHDASGRLVRTLDARRGAISVSWDGRDSGGAPVAPGVYFARTEDAPAMSPVKITCLR